MDNCIFCKIGKGEIPGHKVYEDSTFLAFLDVKPHSKGHTVVIPKTHGVTVFDYSDKQLQELMVAVRKTMDKYRKCYNQMDSTSAGIITLLRGK